MSNKIGVLITYFNEKELLTECLNSLLGQTRSPEEILIYDDGSHSPASDYVTSNWSGRIIRSDANRGPSYGRNVLLRESQCDYIHFHDADDFFEKNWCQYVYEASEQHKVDVVFTEASLHKNGVVYQRWVGLDALDSGRDLVRFCINAPLGTPMGTWRKETLHCAGGYNERLWRAEDIDLNLRLAQRGITYATIDEPLVGIRYRSASLSRANPVETSKGVLQVVSMHADNLGFAYSTDLANRMAMEGMQLYRLGAIAEAKHAFSLSRRLGKPLLMDQRRLYRILARTIGLELTERLGVSYRAFVPTNLRTYIAKCGL